MNVNEILALLIRTARLEASAGICDHEPEELTRRGACIGTRAR